MAEAAAVTAAPRRPNRTLKHFGLMLVFLLFGFVAALSWQAWRQQEADARAELSTLVEVGARALDSYLNQLEISLKILAEALSETTSADGHLNLPRARELVRQFHRLHTELADVAVARADGQVVVVATAADHARPRSIGAERSFRNFSSAMFFGVDVGQPMIDPSTERWIIPVRYRIDDRYQSLRYVISADLPIEFFAGFWKHTPIVEKVSIGVVRDDGFLVSRYPLTGARTEEEIYGAAMSETLFRELREREFPAHAAFHDLSSPDGWGRLYVVRRLPQYPLTLFATMPSAEIWAGWWSKVQSSFLLALIVLIGGAAVYVVASRRQRIHEASLDRALRAAELASRELDAALDNMSHGICMFDASHRVVVMNDRYTEIYGFPPGLVGPGTPLTDIIAHLVAAGIVPEDPEERNFADFLADMAAGHITQTIRELRDGRTIVVTNKPLPDGGWVATHEDITDRRRAEHKLEQTQRFLNAVIEYTPAILSVKQVRTQTYALVNRAASLLFGYRSELMIGKTVHELFGQEQAQYFAARDTEAISARGLPIVHEHTVTAPYNGTRILTTTKLTIPDASGEPEYLMSFSEDITERRQVEASIAYMAHHDPLTGLANRLLLRERLENALQSVNRGASIAVLYLDLDHFKSINDTLGHSVGDEFLKVIAGRLTRCVREIDMVARLGGDEFVILLTSIESGSEAEVVARRVREAVTVPVDIDQQHIIADVSIGISIAPSDAGTAEQLLKNADMALYGAKADGRGTYRFFEAAMDAQVKERRTLELDLRKALANNEFELCYQPIVNIERNEITACEALLRWHHPTRGLVSPAEFVPVAEDTGLITSIGEWVLRTACAQAATWPADIKVAVNVSPAQFRCYGLVPAVISALAASDLPSSRLELEVTEAVLLHNNETTLATLRQLDELGLRVSLDDFGTGYSSLSYLRSFPFDKIKIDKSFIHDLIESSYSASIVRAVTSLANELQMATTAEGVETPEQLKRLREFGCTEMQGYLFSHPLRAGELADFLAAIDAKSRATRAA